MAAWLLDPKPEDRISRRHGINNRLKVTFVNACDDDAAIDIDRLSQTRAGRRVEYLSIA